MKAVNIGLGSSYLALGFGCLFFLYALKYYVSTILTLLIFWKPEQEADEAGEQEYEPYLDPLDEPFISIHLPFYNEVNVARRVIQACINIDYDNFEILVADDSRDETIEVLKEAGWRRGSPLVKFIHRKDRTGFKGGALSEALKYMHPESEFVVVFDADFLPPPDILRRFLQHFEKDHLRPTMRNLLNKKRDPPPAKPIACVQGYQLHYLNKRENWITRGVRAEFAGSYMVERAAQEFFGAMKMVAGSVFMFRADLLRELGWSTSITEDWELTLRLYLKGYRVVYTPLIQAPAEIPNTVKRLARQRMRWAEGHTHAVKRYFWRVLKSKNLTLGEKLEFLYYAPYYLQSLFFILGTGCWVIAEASRRHSMFWNSTFGWSLVLSNLCAIPLMMLAGIFIEGDLQEDYSGVFSFIALSYILTPFQAYAAVKGLFEKEEGTWIRTFKTGTITDRVLNLKFRWLIQWLLSRVGKVQSRPTEKPRALLLPSITVRNLLVTAAVGMMVLPLTIGLIMLNAQPLEDHTVHQVEEPLSPRGVAPPLSERADALRFGSEDYRPLSASNRSINEVMMFEQILHRERWEPLHLRHRVEYSAGPADVPNRARPLRGRVLMEGISLDSRLG